MNVKPIGPNAAFSALRNGTRGKADAVLVVRLYQRPEGGWDTEGDFRHWLAGVPAEHNNALLPGVPAAVIAMIAKVPLPAAAIKIAKLGMSSLAPVVGQAAVNLAGAVMDAVTKPKD